MQCLYVFAKHLEILKSSICALLTRNVCLIFSGISIYLCTGVEIGTVGLTLFSNAAVTTKNREVLLGVLVHTRAGGSAYNCWTRIITSPWFLGHISLARARNMNFSALRFRVQY